MRCGRNDKIIKATIFLFENGEELGPHARLPEMVDMIGDAHDGLVFRLRMEERRNLVGHVDQFRRRRLMTFVIHIAPIELSDSV